MLNYFERGVEKIKNIFFNDFMFKLCENNI